MVSSASGTRSLFGGFIVLPPSKKFVEKRDRELVGAVIQRRSTGSYHAQVDGFSGLDEMSRMIREED